MLPLKSEVPGGQKIKALLKASSKSSLEIFILAGGKSSRMGRDKSRLQLGSQTLLSRIQAAARATGRPVKTVRRDSIPSCGPLSGIYTALTKTSEDAVLFLACDMPILSPELLQKIISSFNKDRRPLFTKTESAGFPFILPRAVLPVVEGQIEEKQFSLHALAKKIKARLFRPGRKDLAQLCNVNTPQEWASLKTTAGLRGAKK